MSSTPQQMHIDLTTDDLAAADRVALEGRTSATAH
jgi:hypothetical protein